jgi:thymidylate kinase
MLSLAFYFMPYRGKSIAFDGLSLAGKSTMVQMLLERSLDAEVVRENTYDPHRPATSAVNRLLKNMDPRSAVNTASQMFSDSKKVLEEAERYASRFGAPYQKQALLAYIFTAGRSVVDSYVRETTKKHDVILDRWQVTGWAYQVEPEGYTWHEIKKLNEQFNITVPDVQFILTCPIEQIPARRAYREKQGIGTAGQMSKGREHIILPAFLEIDDYLKVRMPVYLYENSGVPAQNLEDQIKQAAATFRRIEKVAGANGFMLRADKLADEEAFWLDTDRLARIYERQTR